jgi:hypothetical protein
MAKRLSDARLYGSYGITTDNFLPGAKISKKQRWYKTKEQRGKANLSQILH